GTGYVDYRHASGDAVRWAVNADAAGGYALEFRYANGSAASRPMELTVGASGADATSFTATIDFAPTGSWRTWKTLALSVPLGAGANRVRLTATGKSGPNLDMLRVRPGPPGPPAGITLTDGVLTVVGGDANDTITIATGRGFLWSTLNGDTRLYEKNLVERIDVFGGGGDDSVAGYVDSFDGAPPFTADGGPGNDTLTGGPGDDTLR